MEQLTRIFRFLPFIMLFPLLLPEAGTAQQFSKVTGQPPVAEFAAARSVNWIDVNGDGYLDLFVSHGKAGGQNNTLFINGGPPNFDFIRMDTSVVSRDNEPSDGSSWGDINNDGYPDLFVANWYGRNNLLYLNHGAGSHHWMERLTTPIVAADGGYSETGSWGDYDGDGLLDMYVANSAGALTNYLYHNLGNYGFEKITTSAATADLGQSRGVNWVDYDNDGDLDLFVAREGGGDELLYKNMLKETGTATFTKITQGPLVNSGGNSWSGSWGDYDNDGRLDVFVTTQAGGASRLYHNEGADSFSVVSSNPLTTLVDSYGTASWVDYDNDGDLDLFITTAYAASPSHCYLYKNNLMETGLATFTQITTEALVQESGNWYGVSWGDYNEDGMMDVFVAGTQGENSKCIWYRNNGNSNHYFELNLAGTVSNRSGIGAHIRVKATINGNPVWQLREVDGQSGYCGQNLTQNFGLGNATVIDSMIIDWPSGRREVYAGLSVDRHVSFVEGDTSHIQLVSPSRGEENLPPDVTLQWERSYVAAPYHLQVAEDSLFTAPIVDDSTLADSSYALSALATSQIYFWRVRPVRALAGDFWSQTGYFTSGKPRVTVSTRNRWNLISLPVLTTDVHVGSNFSNSTGPAYQYNGTGYVATDSLLRGPGYWLRCASDTTYELVGDRGLLDTVEVSAGWNLIGAASKPVAVSSIISEPGGILESPFYGYSGRYADEVTLMPGRGYWVKSGGNGRIILTVSASQASKMKP